MSWVDDLRRLLRRAKQQPPTEAAPDGIPCEEAMDHLFEWLDQEVVDADLEAKVGAHLETCAARELPDIGAPTAARTRPRNALPGTGPSVGPGSRIRSCIPTRCSGSGPS